MITESQRTAALVACDKILTTIGKIADDFDKLREATDEFSRDLARRKAELETDKASPCKAVNDAVLGGYLEPTTILDGQGRELRGYMPTAKGRVYFGGQFSRRFTVVNGDR